MPWQHAGSTADLPALPSSTGTAALGAGAGPNGAGAAAPAVGGGGGVVGVSGIVRREQHKTSETGKSLDVAFQDLSALMAMAQAMVQLAERFRGVRAAAQGGGNGGGGAGEEDVMDAETQLELISMGIASPVTKESSGARYHTQLSRQLADFLQQPLAKHGGMLTLPDVYCLFNRARGTELVSPDDLLTAAGLFPSIGVPLRLRRFASGVMVVQSGLHSEEQMAQRIAQLVEGEGCGPGLSAAELAAALGISVTIAREHLLNAEGQGLLCRDDSHEGLRFYRNFFKLVELPAAMPAC